MKKPVRSPYDNLCKALNQGRGSGDKRTARCRRLAEVERQHLRWKELCFLVSDRLGSKGRQEPVAYGSVNLSFPETLLFLAVK